MIWYARGFAGKAAIVSYSVVMLSNQLGKGWTFRLSVMLKFRIEFENEPPGTGELYDESSIEQWTNISVVKGL